MKIWVFRSNFNNFGSILIISDITQIRINVCYVCLLQVPWSLVSNLIFSILLLGYIKRKSYFSFVNDSAIEQINLKKEP